MLYIGTVTYYPDRDAIIWTIKQFSGSKEYLMRAHFGLPSIQVWGSIIWYNIVQYSTPYVPRVTIYTMYLTLPYIPYILYIFKTILYTLYLTYLILLHTLYYLIYVAILYILHFLIYRILYTLYAIHYYTILPYIGGGVQRQVEGPDRGQVRDTLLHCIRLTGIRYTSSG